MVFDLTCLAIVKANNMSSSSRVVGWRFVTTFNSAREATILSRVCTRKPPAGDEKTKVLLGAQNAAGILISVRRDDHFGEELGDFLGSRAIQRCVEGENASERAHRITGKRLCVCIDQG